MNIFNVCRKKESEMGRGEREREREREGEREETIAKGLNYQNNYKTV